MKKSNTKDIESTTIKCLIYGKSKIGKTSTAKTLLEKETLIISAESGLLPLTGKNYDVWEIESWTDIIDSQKEAFNPALKYKNIFIDSLTEISELCKKHIVYNDRPKLKRNLGNIYDDVMTIEDWNPYYYRIYKLVSDWRNINRNVVFLALEDEKEDKKTGKVTVCPFLGGKAGLYMPGYFDEVFRMIVKNNSEGKSERFFLTDETEKSLAGDRSGALDKFEIPDLGYIFNKIKSSFKKEK